MWFAVFCVVSVTSVACSFCLVGVANSWNLAHLWDSAWSFKTSTWDVLLLSLSAVLVLPFIAWRASKTLPVADDADDACCSCFRCCYAVCPEERRGYSKLLSSPNETISPFNSQSIQTREGDTMAQPLLKAAGFAGAPSSHAIPVESQNQEVDDEKKQQEKRKQSEQRRDVHLFALFILATAAQIYLAVKCISFEFGDNESTEGALLGLGVLWVNMQVVSLRELVGEVSGEDDGVYIAALHNHKLLPQGNKNVMHRCDLCGLNCGTNSSRCKMCDFDVCFTCLKRAQKKGTASLEGQIRGDKGVAGGGDGSSSKSYLPKMIALLKTEKSLFACGMTFLIAGNLASLLTPTVQGSILDAVFTNNDEKFKHWILVYVATAVSMGIVSSVRSLSFSIIGKRISATLKLQLFRAIINQDVSFFDGNHTGDLSSRLSSDVWFLVAPIQQLLGSVVSNSLLLIGGMVMCFWTSWRLSMLAFTTVGPIVYVTQTYASWSSEINAQIYAAVGKANSIAVEALTNVRTVKSTSSEKYEQRRYFDATCEALEKGVRDAWVGSIMTAINTSLDLFSTVLILWYGGYLAMRQDQGMTAGRLVTFQLYFNMLNGAYSSLLDLVTQLTRSAGAASRVFDLMDNVPDIDSQTGRSAKNLRGEIELRDVSFFYQMRPEKQVLKGVSLHIPAGTVCALVGQSGGGKSTVVAMLMRFYDCTAGSILLDGQDLRELRLRDVRKQMGVVQQSTDLFAGTIEENIMYGCNDEDDEDEDDDNGGDVLRQMERRKARLGDAGRAGGGAKPAVTHEMVVEAAKKACAHDFIMSFPDQYATRIGERGVRISGGQKQRISIARAFLRRPRILLLDEATSALDAESEGYVQEALDRLIAERGATILLVAHRLSTVINADQIVVLREGAVVESGSYDQLLALRGEFYSLVQRQLKKKGDVLSEAPGSSEGEGKGEED